MFKKYEKDFLRRGFHSWNKFVLHALNKTNTTIHDLFSLSLSLSFSKSTMLRKINSVSKKDTISFYLKKNFRFASNEDEYQFFI